MNTKLVIIGGILLFGITVNLGLLYVMAFELRSDVSSLQDSAVSRTHQTDEEDMPAATGIPTTQTATSSAAFEPCVRCRQDIDELKSIIAQITPASGVSFSTTPSSSGNQVKEVFVPLSTGSTRANDWEDIPGMVATINTANYSKIKGASFEIALRIPTSHGTVYARLFNKTDKHPVWFSDVSTEGPVSTVKKANITLDGGEKLYQVQMKTTLQAESIADSAYIKITLE